MLDGRRATEPFGATVPGAVALDHLLIDERRIAPFDGLRGVAAATVVLYHLQSMAFLPGKYLDSAHLCVDFFFILSGFIIARQYEASIADRSIGFRAFAVRRLARLYPTYLLSLLVILSAELLGLPALAEELVIRTNAPVLGAFLQVTMLHHIGWRNVAWNFPTWSVSVEWVVNLVFFATVFHFRKSPRFLICLTIYFCVACLMRLSPKLLTLDLWEAKYGLLNGGVARGLIGFGLGVMLFQCRRRLPNMPASLLHGIELAVAAGTIVAFRYGTSPPFRGSDYVQVLFLFPALIALCLYRRSWLGRLFSFPVPVGLGLISYSVYVLHIPLLTILAQPFRRAPSPWGAIVFGLALLVVSWLSYRFVEKPGARLITRLGSG